MGLCTAAQVKTSAGITGSGNDTLIGEIIDAVTAQMEHHMGRPIEATTYTAELHDGDGRNDFIVLNHGPLTSTGVTAITLDGTSVLSDVLAPETTWPDGERRVFYQPGSLPTAWPKGRQNISVTYQAGWSTVPADLERAAVAEVRWRFGQTQPGGGAEKLDVVSVGSDQRGTTQYQVDPSGFLVQTVAAMRPYRRRAWL